MSEHYKFSQNKKCEYFPCHKGIKEAEFNCLFCYCPLYMLQGKCGGNYKYTNGIKDCSDCAIIHNTGGFEYVMSKMSMIMKIGSKKRILDL